MNLIALFQTILYGISSVLLYPVILLILGTVCYVVILAGRFCSEYIRRKTIRKNFDIDHLIDQLEKDFNPQSLQGLSIPPNLKRHLEGILREYHKERGNLDIRVESLLQEEELRLQTEMKKIGVLVRFGPTLGLMGTLIPMGTALTALSQGNMEVMASNLIIAFTTTVVGLATGISAYVLSLIKDRWVHEDIRQMEYLTEVIMRKLGRKFKIEIPEETAKDFWETS